MKIEHLKVVGIEDSFRGMRNPKNSWHLSDSKLIDTSNITEIPNHLNVSIFDKTYKFKTTKKLGQDYIDGYEFTENDFDNYYVKTDDLYLIGEKDLKLAKDLIAAGTVHSKFDRMIICYMDLTASFDFWKEYDTYKVGTVADSCSTMHKITSKEIVIEDFSTADLRSQDVEYIKTSVIPYLNSVLNDKFISNVDKTRILSKLNILGYEQKRTLELSYGVLHNMFQWRHCHKLYEWRYLCKNIIQNLPYFDALFLDD